MRILTAVTKRGSGNANRPRAAHDMLARWSMVVNGRPGPFKLNEGCHQLKRQQSKSKLEVRILTSVTKRCSGNANRMLADCSWHVVPVVNWRGSRLKQNEG